jgi:hypothetical protein
MKLKLLVTILLIQSCNFFALSSMADPDADTNPKKIIPLIEAAVKNCDQCLAMILNNKKVKTIVIKQLIKHMEQAAHLYMRYYIRIYQDAACCTDSTIIGHLTEKVQQREFHFTLTSFFNKSELKEIFLKQIEEVENKTTNNQLPSPDWIGPYSTKILSTLPTPIIIPESEWLKTRQNALKTVEFEKIYNS